MDQQSDKIFVTTLYPYRAQNTDELSFAKHETIVLTQAPVDGGWWEGTLNGKTGWFPSNYVDELVRQTDSTPSTQSTVSQQCMELQQQRDMVIRSLLNSEQVYITTLEHLQSRMIQPLLLMLSSSSNIQFDFQQLDQLIEFHHHLAHVVRESNKNEHCLGAIFLQLASTLKPIFETYCIQHAKLLFLFNQHRDRVYSALNKLDRYQDVNLTYHELIRNLSLPVNRLEKYASVLKEYYHHLEEFHMDRGDTQRASEYYTELSCAGSERRKKHEWELEIVHSPIQGVGPEILQALGDSLCLSSVHVLSDSSQYQIILERIALLYPTVLFLLSSSSMIDGHRLENRFLIDQISISKIIDDHHFNKRSLKITLISNNQSWIVIFPSSLEYHEWCDQLSRLLPIQISQPMPKSANVIPEITITSSVPKHATWLKNCLRPHSPLRARPQWALNANVSATTTPIANLSSAASSTDPLNHLNDSGSGNRTLKRIRSLKKAKANEFLKRVETSEGDSLLLSVIEAYCISNHPTGTAIAQLNTLITRQRQMRQEQNNQKNIPMMSVQPSSLITTMTPNLDAERQAMFDILHELQLRYKVLVAELREERRARQRLERQIQRLFIMNTDTEIL